MVEQLAPQPPSHSSSLPQLSSNNPYRKSENSNKPHPKTPSALFNHYQSSSTDHLHEFRVCYAFTITSVAPSVTDINMSSSVDTAAMNDELPSYSVASLPAELSWSARFLCHTCHAWLLMTSSCYRHTCSREGYLTHHYHMLEGSKTAAMDLYQCCGCDSQVQLELRDPLLSSDLLQRLSASRPMMRSYLDTAEQTTLKPTLSSTLSTCQIYIKDLIEGARRNINSKNPRFMERVGLDEITLQLLNTIGFTFHDGQFIPPAQVDNERLYMMREELTASLLEISRTTNEIVSVTVNEADCPLAEPVILYDLLGCQDDVEHGTQVNRPHLERPCGKLGVTSSASDDLIVWAYRKLMEEYPELMYDWLDTLNDITAIKGGEVLQTEVAIERSKGFISNKDVISAYQHFGAQMDIEDETLIAAHQYKIQDFPRLKSVHDEKLLMIGESRKSAGIMRYLQDGQIKVSCRPQEDGYEQSTIELYENTPVGLTNIGNTCYLNSLLQYYYTLLPFRNTIINMDEFVENEDKLDWQTKKIGGIEVDQKEVKRAKKFVGLLRELFLQLGNTEENEIAPDLELAKMTLFNEKQEEDITDKNESCNVEVKDGNSSMEESVSTLVESKKGSDDECVGGLTLKPAAQPPINDNTTIKHTLINEKVFPASTMSALTATTTTTLSPAAVTSLSTSSSSSTGSVTSSPATTTTTPNQRAVPPPPAAKKPDMNAMMFGKQQDVTECMGNVMYLVEAALKPQETENLEQTRDMIRDLFYGKARQILSYKDTKTTATVQKVKEEDFSHVIVDAAAGKNLYDGLNEYFFADQLENFQGGQEAIREVSVRSFPPVLQIQVQRVQFDRITSRAYKSNAFVQFDKTIYLDRYLDSNFEALASRRAKVTHWKSKLAHCRQIIEGLSTEKTLHMPVPTMLELTAECLATYKSDDAFETSPAYQEAIDGLKKLAESAKLELEETIKEAKEYETRIRHEYDDLTKCAYVIHAVFMHQGAAEYGHYWLYILDHVNNQWYKFNDARVTKVAESEVFKDTSGETANPYYLVYVNKERIESLAAVAK